MVDRLGGDADVVDKVDQVGELLLCVLGEAGEKRGGRGVKVNK